MTSRDKIHYGVADPCDFPATVEVVGLDRVTTSGSAESRPYPQGEWVMLELAGACEDVAPEFVCHCGEAGVVALGEFLPAILGGRPVTRCVLAGPIIADP